MAGIGGKAAVLLSIIAVAGCGGGNESKGGGSLIAAAGSGWGTQATGTETMTFSQTTLSTTFPSGDSVPLPPLRATTNAPIDWRIFTYIASDRANVLRSISLSRISATEYEAAILTDSSLPPGTYTGTVQIAVCHDPPCSKPFANSPVTLSYEFEVTPPNRFSTLPVTIAQSQIQGQASEASVSLMPSQPLGGPLYFRMGAAEAIVANSGSFVVQGTSILATFKFVSTLAPGRHDGYASFAVCYDAECVLQVSGSPVSLPYALTVLP